MKWRLVLESIAAAAAAGAGDAVIQKVSAGGPINGKSIGITAGIGAAIGIVNLLRKPPVAQPAPVEPPK